MGQPPQMGGSGGQMPSGINPCSSTSSSTQKLTVKQRLSAINACRVSSKAETSVKKRIKSFSSCVSQIGKTNTSSIQTPSGGGSSDNSNVSIVADTTGYSLATGTASESNKSYSANSADTSAIVVKDGANYTLSDSTITKTGDSSNDGNSSFYGLNAGVIAKNGGIITLENVVINATGRGANGAFATGDKSVLTMKNSKITAK
jgi:hypothetical protein